MNLSRCPKCGSTQKLTTLLTMNNLSNKKCHKCGCGIMFEPGASTLLFILIISPLFLLNLLKESLPVINPILFLLWFLVGVAGFLFFVPLIEKNET